MRRIRLAAQTLYAEVDFGRHESERRPRETAVQTLRTRPKPAQNVAVFRDVFRRSSQAIFIV